MIPHFIYDLLACVAALSLALWQRAKYTFPASVYSNRRYVLVLLLGAVCGGYGFGTWNLAISHEIILAHSVLGALVGAIFFIEFYKGLIGIRASTGAPYALPFCGTVAVGRIGCLLAGMNDMTYGVPTDLPWGMDFGDGISRHPVQLYEALTMACVGAGCVLWLKRDVRSYMILAFPSVVSFYAVQRFCWEFLKPYSPVIGRLNIFHILCLALLSYGISVILWRMHRVRKATAA